MNIPKWHPAADAYPFMAEAEFDALKHDIRQYGQRKPVEVYMGTNFPEWKGSGIDGRNRCRACAELGVEPVIRELTDRDVGESITAYIAGVNTHRRRLSSSQASMVADDLRPCFENEARAAQNAGRKRGGEEVHAKKRAELRSLETDESIESGLSEKIQTSRNFPSDEKKLQETGLSEKIQTSRIDLPQDLETDDRTSVEAAQKAATVTGTNTHYVYDAAKIKAESPALAKMVREGRLTIIVAKALLQMKESEPEVFQRIENGEIAPEHAKHLTNLKKDWPEVYVGWQEGKSTLAEAIDAWKKRKKQLRKQADGETASGEGKPASEEPQATALPIALILGNPVEKYEEEQKRRVLEALEEMGEEATPGAIADRAGVSRSVAERHLFGPQDETKPLFDGLGRRVPECVRDAFLAMNHLHQATRQLHKARACLKEVGRRFGEHYLSEAAQGDVDRALIEIQTTAPYVVCPICSGTGIEPTVHREACLVCRLRGRPKGVGWIHRAKFAELSKELQLLCRLWAEEDQSEATPRQPQ